MVKLHCCTLQTQMTNQSKINPVAIKGTIYHEGLEICAFLSLLRPIVACLAESPKNWARPVVAAYRASVSPRELGAQISDAGWAPRANSASRPGESAVIYPPAISPSGGRSRGLAAGAGGQNPPRRSGAGAAEPAAVGVAVPATYGRLAPLSQTLGWVSPWGYLRNIGRGSPGAGVRSRRSEATPEVGGHSRGDSGSRSRGPPRSLREAPLFQDIGSGVGR